jgi:hypothetical protein
LGIFDRYRRPLAAGDSSPLSAFTSIRIDLRALQNHHTKCPAIDRMMETPMGKTFALFSTDPIVQRRLREAHAARNAYIRALLGALIARCRSPWMRPHRERDPAGECGAVRVRAAIDRH